MFDKAKFINAIEPQLKYLGCLNDQTKQRYISAVEKFFALYGETDDFHVFSVSGRSEICGNHTDHNHGKVAAASIDLDIIAVAAKCDGCEIMVKSEGFDEDIVDISSLSSELSENFGSAALIRGVCDGLNNNGRNYGAFHAYTESRILKGSGLSSSAAFEDMIGTIENHLYNNGSIDYVEISKISQYAENVHFGKPCGLMDQMACAAGGFVGIDFEVPSSPKAENVAFDIDSHGYSLYIVNTGGSHADLNDDYASVPAEMKAVAHFFGKDVLRGISEKQLNDNALDIRRECGDRALLRAYHFVHENARVDKLFEAISRDDMPAFLSVIRESGVSSATLLQNYYSTKAPHEQGIALACAVAQSIMGDDGACRVHGGGFAGTAQVFVPKAKEEAFKKEIETVFGAGSATKLSIRAGGAVKIY